MPTPSVPERRDSYRCPSDGNKTVIMWVGKQSLNVRIINESRHGIAVLSSQNPGAERNETVEIELNDGVHRMRVVKVRRIGAGHRIGLERLEDGSISIPR